MICERLVPDASDAIQWSKRAIHAFRNGSCCCCCGEMDWIESKKKVSLENNDSGNKPFEGFNLHAIWSENGQAKYIAELAVFVILALLSLAQLWLQIANCKLCNQMLLLLHVTMLLLASYIFFLFSLLLYFCCFCCHRNVKARKKRKNKQMKIVISTNIFGGQFGLNVFVWAEHLVTKIISLHDNWFEDLIWCW